jgi:uncharacterized surface protein with fasciclin (FAS1) repeats
LLQSALHTRMAPTRKRSRRCDAGAETRFATPRISIDDADTRAIAGAITGYAPKRVSQQIRSPQMSNRVPYRFTLIAAAAAIAFAAGTAAPLSAETMSEKTVNVGGAPMYPSKNIIQNAVNSKDHTTLVAAVKAAGLVDTLSGAGPFTVFAPTNEAFAKLPAGTVDNLLKPENKATLTKVLTYHFVPGRLSAASLMKAVKDGEGQAKLKTVSGDWLIVKQAGPGKLSVTDATGDVAMVTIADVMQSNGVIHVVDTVLLPM